MILLDTSFLVAHSLELDVHHKKAVQLREEITSGKYGAVYITDYIFDEFVTVLLVRLRNVSKIIKICEIIRNLERIQIDDLIFKSAWEKFKAQKETLLSFTDCASLACMQHYSINYIATLDKEFEETEGVRIVN